MTYPVKHLPDAAVPADGAARWTVADANVWSAARPPAALAPVLASRLMVPLVLLAVVLLAWNEPDEAGTGTSWSGYPAAVLLLALPFWFRHLPGAAAVAAVPVGAHGLLGLLRLDPADTAGVAGSLLVIALCLWALAGSLVRLRGRRIQRRLGLAAAGGTRAELPRELSNAHHRRGTAQLFSGAALCVAAVGLLAWGLAEDLGAPDGGPAGGAGPYDAIGQQLLAMVLLVAGGLQLGRGLTARLAVRRLHRGPQPVLRVGLRDDVPDGRELCWLLADADTTTAPPLIAFRRRLVHTYAQPTVLLGGPEERLREQHHDVDPRSEPFEAFLYGAPSEGAEVVLEWAAQRGPRITTMATAAVLLPAPRRDRLHGWRPANTSRTLVLRREQERVKAAEAEGAKKGAEKVRSNHPGGGAAAGCSTGTHPACSTGTSPACSTSTCSSSSSCGGGCGGGD
ncbi:hypothetical protein [Streptomyces sp. NPDC060194]|uniref:hypothetical protein n=1 Tax=Streptomyces sp. NPDC060194 TaxID=3347069 RepID=UPI003662439A